MDRNIACRRTAQKCVREGDIDQAIEAYEEVVSSGDADPYDFVYAGDLYVKLDLTEEAIARFRRGVAAYSRLGFNRNAIALCRRVLRIDGRQHDVQRELGDLFATEELLDDALDSYLLYLEGTDSNAREDEAFRETLARAEDLAPRRPAYATRLSEFLESLGHTEASADVLSRASDLARSAGAEDVASELMERALGLNPALSRAANVAESIEERLHQVHRSKVEAGAESAPGPDGGTGVEGGVAVGEGSACEDASADKVYEIEIPDETATDDVDEGEEELSLPGFQEVDFANGAGSGAGSDPAVEHLATIEGRHRGVAARHADLPAVDRVEIQDSAHPAVEADESEPAASSEAPVSELTAPAPDEPAVVIAAESPLSEATATGEGALGSEEEAREQDAAEAAREAMVGEDWKLARRWVEAWLLKDPTSHEAADAMIRTCEAQQDRSGIIEGLTLKGDLLIQGQELPSAVPLFWRVLEMDPQNDTAQRRMARFRELGLVASDAEPGDAAADATGAEDSPPERIESKERQGSTETHAGRRAPEEPIDPAAALTVLAALRGAPKPSVEPPQSESHYAQGLVHMETGHLSEALLAFDAALKEPGLDAPQSTKLWELRAKCLSAQGEHRAAIAELQPVVARLGASDRGAAALHYFLALEHETLGEFDAAKERLRKVIESAPNFEQASRRLSQLEERAA